MWLLSVLARTNLLQIGAAWHSVLAQQPQCAAELRLVKLQEVVASAVCYATSACVAVMVL